jgi:DNA-binding response OmpR family regulator
MSTSAPTRPGVLVVDDDPHLRHILGLALPCFGFTAWLAPGGEEALALYRAHPREVALALLDVVMPGLDGPATLLALRELDPCLPCCFMTGVAGEDTPADLLALGARRVFLKPFRLDELAAALWGLLGGSPAPTTRAP